MCLLTLATAVRCAWWGWQELKKACSQVKFSYAVNRRLPHPIQYYLTSLTGETRNQLNIQSSDQLDRWDVRGRHPTPSPWPFRPAAA